MTGFALAAVVMAGGVSGRTLHAQAAAGSGAAVTDADVRFMQEMRDHHAQAVQMTALLRSRTRRADLRALGERMSVSQTDEMALMSRWLTRHGAPGQSGMATGAVGSASGRHTMSEHDMVGTAHATMMPGMLSALQMSELRAARGERFERLFLQGMIQHHMGALTMVQQLMATPAAAQHSETNRLVTDIDADQRAEIRRMRRMLAAM